MTRLIIFLTLMVATADAMAQPVRDQPGIASSANVHRISKSDRSGTAVSVRVPDGTLVFTGQVFAVEASGDARAQADRALQALAALLTNLGSDLGRVVRLYAYVADDGAVASVAAAVASRFASSPPAFTLVRTPLTTAGALVAFEAVATSSRTPVAVEVVSPAAALLPAGAKIFISGQAERGTDLGSATKVTMAGLFRSLAHLGLKKADVVQVKAFIKPFADHAAARREIMASFGDGSPPPIVLMEWVSDLYTEIELVASARNLPAALTDSISFAWLPWLPKSPRYCNVVTVAANTPLIFIGAVDGGDTGGARAQMKTIFERLGSILFESGSSYRSLAKATYYLADPSTRSLLGELRAVYFEPTRPPAASALGVNGLGPRGRAAMLDMIAVPAK